MPVDTVINNIRADTVAITDSAFSECAGLTSITIPNSVISIGWNAFSGCRSLTSITIPSSITTIEPGAFYECPLLPTVRNDIKKRFGEGPFMRTVGGL